MFFKNDIENIHKIVNVQSSDLETRKSRFKALLEGIEISCPDDILHRFCLMPASRNHHGNYEGGLMEHSVNAATVLCGLSDELGCPWSNERSPIVVGLFHDLCKIDLYESTEDGYIYAANAAPGHGSKSVEIAKSFIPDLTLEEELSIRWHMGAFDDRNNWRLYTDAIHQYPAVLLTHTADMIASHVIEI